MITIDKKEFLEGLNIGGAMAGHSKTMPMYEFAKIDIKGTTMIVSSCDGDASITKRVEMLSNTDGDFAFCANPKDIVAVIKSINDTEIKFEVVNNTMLITHKKGEMQLPTRDADNFPMLSEGDIGNFATLKAKDLFNALKEASLFVAADEVRLVMNGVYLRFEDNVMSIASTDGRKIYCNVLPCSYTQEPMEGIVKHTSAILSLINGADDVHVCVGERNIYVKVFDSMLCARRIEGNYPKYKTVIPTSHNMTARILVSDLMDSARRVSMASPTDSNLLKLTMRGATLEISSEDVMVNKRAKETHLCEVVGGDLQIGVSSQMLANCLSVIESEYVTMRFMDATRPIVYIDEANDNKIALSMPMRVE